MIRAGVFIGVNQSGPLHKLNDAAAGARRMRDWALQQGLDPARAVLITDDTEPVDAAQIIKAIKAFHQGAGVEQILVYFAGHGVNIDKNEYWLLSDAPKEPLSVINVRGSAAQAEYGLARYVVIISDACRVPAEGIQGQGVASISSVVFPNDVPDGGLRPVDMFYATGLGRAAAELGDPAAAAAAASQAFRAVYTDAMLDGLAGKGDFAMVANLAGEPGMYVRPAALADWLAKEVTSRIRARGLLGSVNQKPEARVCASDITWLSRLDPAALSSPASADREDPLGAAPAADPGRRAAFGIVRAAVRGDQPLLAQSLAAAQSVPAPDVIELARNARNLALPFGPQHMESQCGFKLRGAEVESALAVGAAAEVLPALPGHDGGSVIRLGNLQTAAVSVVLRFKGGFGTVIPALAGFLTALSFDRGELVDVSYEPSDNQGRWGDYHARIGELRMLRAVAASALRQGRFKLDGDDAQALAAQMQVAKGIDPTTAVYAAYAYDDLQMVDRIRQMQEYLASDLGLRWFDVSLLARSLVGKTIDRASGVVPFVPLLSQGWALLPAHRVQLHPLLTGLQATMKPSLWSLYDGHGVDMLERALHSGDVI
ncbi:MAG: caspase family protein [Rhodanobacter sp.]